MKVDIVRVVVIAVTITVILVEAPVEVLTVHEIEITVIPVEEVNPVIKVIIAVTVTEVTTVRIVVEHVMKVAMKVFLDRLLIMKQEKRHPMIRNLQHLLFLS